MASKYPVPAKADVRCTADLLKIELARAIEGLNNDDPLDAKRGPLEKVKVRVTKTKIT